MLRMEKRQDKVLEVLGNQNLHNQTLMDLKNMFSKFLRKLKDHVILTPSKPNSGYEH